MCGTAAEVSAVNSVDDRDPVPRSDDQGHRRDYARAIHGQEDKYKDWCEHVA